MHLFARTFAGFRVNAVRSGLTATAAGACKALSHGDLLDRVKRGLRHRMARGRPG